MNMLFRKKKKNGAEFERVERIGDVVWKKR